MMSKLQKDASSHSIVARSAAFFGGRDSTNGLQACMKSCKERCVYDRCGS